jgi:hypothetical protein
MFKCFHRIGGMTNFSENLLAPLFNADPLNESTFRKERKYLAIVASSADRGWEKGGGGGANCYGVKKILIFLTLDPWFSGSYLKQKLKDIEKSMRLVRRCFRR